MSPISRGPPMPPYNPLLLLPSTAGTARIRALGPPTLTTHHGATTSKSSHYLRVYKGLVSFCRSTVLAHSQLIEERRQQRQLQHGHMGGATTARPHADAFLGPPLYLSQQCRRWPTTEREHGQFIVRRRRDPPSQSYRRRGDSAGGPHTSRIASR